MTPATILLERDRQIGQDDVAVPARTFFRYDDFAAALSNRFGSDVGVIEIDQASNIPDGLLLVDRPETLAVDRDDPADETTSVWRRTIVLHADRTALDELLAAYPVVGAVADARLDAWVWDRHRPQPRTAYVRRDLAVYLAPSLVDPRPESSVPTHLALDQPGRAPVPDLVAAMIEAWRRAQAGD